LPDRQTLAIAEPQSETYPFYSHEWFNAVPTPEQKAFEESPASNWIKGSWPDITGDPDYEAARRFGHTTHPGWIRYFFAWSFDGEWQASGTIEDAATLQQKKKDAVLLPSFLAGSGPSHTDNQRVMSFWVSTHPDASGLRIIDTTGTDPRCDIQLGRV